MSKILYKKIDNIGLSIFRIVFCFILLFEIFNLFEFRHIIFDKSPFHNIGEIDINLIFPFWIASVIFLIFGVFSRYSAIINYLFCVIIFSSAHKFEYHAYFIYLGVSFLLIIMPISRTLSLDSLLKKIKYSTLHSKYIPDDKVLAVNYFIPVLMGLGFTYFDSIFWKFQDDIWISGLGMWLPCNIPPVTRINASFLLNQEFLVKFLGYLVLIFETVFIFLFWFKSFRVPLLIIGVFFHLGILIMYPIPLFALVGIATYLLMVPLNWWNKLFKLFKFKKPKFIFYYDGECPMCIKIVVIIIYFFLK